MHSLAVFFITPVIVVRVDTPNFELVAFGVEVVNLYFEGIFGFGPHLIELNPLNCGAILIYRSVCSQGEGAVLLSEPAGYSSRID